MKEEKKHTEMETPIKTKIEIVNFMDDLRTSLIKIQEKVVDSFIEKDRKHSHK